MSTANDIESAAGDTGFLAKLARCRVAIVAVAMESHQTEQFAALWTAAQSTISAFIRTLIPNVHEADEVMQRVAVVLVRKFDLYDATRPFVAWAIGVAKYEVLYYRRDRATDKHRFNDDLVHQIASRYEVFATETDPIREALEYCVDELKGRSKCVIEFRYRDGLTSNVIAGKMGMSAGSVRMLLCRVRDALRRCIESRTAGRESSPATQ